MAIAEMPAEDPETQFPLIDVDELDSELAMALEDAGSPEGARQGKKFVIENEAAADWAMRKLQKLQQRLHGSREAAREQVQAIDAAAQVRIQEILSRAKELIEPIETWLAEQEEKLGPDIAFFEDLLTRYHLEVLAEDPDRKTLKLPHGSIEARKKPDQWIYTDEAVFLDYARASKPALIRVIEAPAKDAVKKAFALAPSPNDDGSYDVVDPATGDIIPGLTVNVGPVVVTVKPEVTA